MVLPPYGFVALQDFAGSDVGVVNAARVSFAQQSEVMSKVDEKVLFFLMRERHGSPFEHNFFKFHVKAPIFVFREWMRHRISSFNEMSGRYTTLKNEFYIPLEENIREQVGKPGNYQFSQLDKKTAKAAVTTIKKETQSAWRAYQKLLDLGVAKEVARAVLPVTTYSQMIWSVNARGLMNFLSLRNATDAQYEIRVYAQAIEDILAETMPLTHQAFIENGRKSP